MSSSVHLSDTMQTTCPVCGSVFRLSNEQLEIAKGQVRCGECQQVFNALLSLENFTDQFEKPPKPEKQNKPQTDSPDDLTDTAKNTSPGQPVSLKQAMYGENYSSRNNFKPFLWVAGILLLIITAIVQVVYYQRYTLISSSQFQQQVLNLCQILPCDESRFSSLSQIKLLERNIFAHPTQDKALMVSGSFVNQASFSQTIPGLMISLSDTQGNFIANRLFTAEEFLTDKSVKRLQPGKPVQFRLELQDPGSEALAYEFEFFI